MSADVPPTGLAGALADDRSLLITDIPDDGECVRAVVGTTIRSAS